MKKFLQSILVLFFFVPFMVNAQDTIVGWSFPLNADTSVYANFGTASNLGTRYLAAEDTAGNGRTITWTTGLSDYAATAEGWENADSMNSWSIKFKAVGFQDLKLYSVQRSGGANPGPKYFKVQYRFSGGEFMDIPGSDTITLGNEWTSGVVANLALPADCNDTNISIYIRWLQLTNEASDGTTVLSTGISKIDNIFILGTPVSISVNENEPQLSLNVYPNPASNYIVIESNENTVIRVMNMVGNVVSENRMDSKSMKLDVSNLSAGLYFLSATDLNNNQTVTRKIVVK